MIWQYNKKFIIYKGSDMNKYMTYKEAMKYIGSVNQYGSVLGLDNIRELLERLHNPQDKLTFIHIAGTNGKGSVGAFLSSILSNARYLVGRYISPVLFEYRERIQIIQNRNISYISEENTSKHLSKIRNVIETMLEEGKSHPTPFEIETAMAFLEFAEQKCDIVVLEVGLGGRLDSTNIINTAKCAVFTSISMDHMGALGDTLEKIAYEKAGIIKPNTFVISAIQEKETEDVIKKTAKEKNASFIFVEPTSICDIDYTLEKTTFSYKSANMNHIERIETTLLGEYQPYNAAVAIETALFLQKKDGYKITWNHIKEGIKNAIWHGRFEIIHKKPMVIIDGAHNEGAALSLRKSIEFYFKGRRRIAIIGIFSDKEYEKILKATLGIMDKVFAIETKNERSLSSYKLAAFAKKYCSNTIDAVTPENAVKLALEEANEEDIILAYGSLSYLHEICDCFK